MTYKTVRKDDGTVTIEVADLDAEMLIKAYVPEADQMTFDEAYSLALERDRDAADGLKMDCCNGAERLTEADHAFAEMVNAALERAEQEDLEAAEQEYHFIVGTLLNVPAVGVTA